MKANSKKHLVGKWRIFHMDDTDKKDLEAEVPAYIKVESGGYGEFQFCFVHGSICGDFLRSPNGISFDFTWEGNDECDEAFGDGWFKTEDGKAGAGQIRLHYGDKYGFSAKKVKK